MKKRSIILITISFLLFGTLVSIALLAYLHSISYVQVKQKIHYICENCGQEYYQKERVIDVKKGDTYETDVRITEGFCGGSACQEAKEGKKSGKTIQPEKVYVMDAEVDIGDGKFTVKNYNDFDWINVKFTVGIFHELSIPELGAGKTRTFWLQEFQPNKIGNFDVNRVNNKSTINIGAYTSEGKVLHWFNKWSWIRNFQKYN